MEANVTLDIGKNATELLQQLAQQAGIAADKIFPWYVQQAYLQGVTDLVMFGGGLVLACTAFALTLRKADFKDGNRYTGFFIASCAACLFLAIGSFVEIPQAVRKILNPNFYAMTMLTDDLAKLTRR